MKKSSFLIMSILIGLVYFTSCGPCNPIIIDNGNLTDSVLNFVPYSNGQICKLKHSNGQIINFDITRASTKEETWCVECCKFIYKYELNTTILTPDYPIFNIQLFIDNLSEEYCNFHVVVGKYIFYISNYYYNSEPFVADSIMIDSNYYYDVFLLKSSNYGLFYTDSIYVDSLYYNYNKGILKISMSNGETYSIYE